MTNFLSFFLSDKQVPCREADEARGAKKEGYGEACRTEERDRRTGAER